jgi:hypothetical protein
MRRNSLAAGHRLFQESAMSLYHFKDILKKMGARMAANEYQSAKDSE